MTKTHRIDVRLEPSLNAQLERYSETLKISKGQLIRNLLSAGVDDLRIMEKTGMLWVASSSQGIVETIKSYQKEKLSEG